MKKILLPILFFLFAGLFSVAATFPEMRIENMSSSAQFGNVTTAYYLSGGSIGSILIKVQSGSIVAICQGRDNHGRQIWDEISPVRYQSNNYPVSTPNREVQDYLRMMKYKATINGVTLYFNI